LTQELAATERKETTIKSFRGCNPPAIKRKLVLN
jgi:hypothetical protein